MLNTTKTTFHITGSLFWRISRIFCNFRESHCSCCLSFKGYLVIPIPKANLDFSFWISFLTCKGFNRQVVWCFVFGTLLHIKK